MLTVLFSSCNAIVEPTLERIEDVDIVEMSKDRLELTASMVLNNPNSFALDIAKADLSAFVDDVELAQINQTYDTSMPSNGEFKMPIEIKMDLKKLYRDNPIAAIGKGLQLMADKKIDVRFSGTIKVGKGSAKISVPIDQIEEVKF